MRSSLVWAMEVPAVAAGGFGRSAVPRCEVHHGEAEVVDSVEADAPWVGGRSGIDDQVLEEQQVRCHHGPAPLLHLVEEPVQRCVGVGTRDDPLAGRLPCRIGELAEVADDVRWRWQSVRQAALHRHRDALAERRFLHRRCPVAIAVPPPWFRSPSLGELERLLLRSLRFGRSIRIVTSKHQGPIKRR